ncbi:hypothetical protein FM109_15880 [Vibrio casei]|nr:hypothetical protein FM109_15880 [Vibrio casei]
MKLLFFRYIQFASINKKSNQSLLKKTLNYTCGEYFLIKIDF